MQYSSTRGEAPALGFEDTIMTGLAPDGGLYMPDHLPHWSADDLRALRGQPYHAVAAAVMRPFLADALDGDTLDRLTRRVYGGDRFRHSATAPLVQLGPNDWVLELFHGPTLAFKDFALQFLGQLFDLFTRRQGRRLTILGATSGDTGSAAIEGCRGAEAVDIFMLHPKGRVSEVQRRQMTTVDAPNVVNIAVDGTFDDCQALVKAAFADAAFRDQVGLSAVNSINWARVMAQIVYYVYAAVALGAPDRPVSFSVPTGNFGDVFAGYLARRMGLPVEMLAIATNANDILTRFRETGRYERGPVASTLSPSMDIGISSNFERLLFDLLDGDSGAVRGHMESLKQSDGFTLPDQAVSRFRGLFTAARVDDAGTVATMKDVLADTGLLLDPHTAIGFDVARRTLPEDGAARVTLATAHPAKFADAVTRVQDGPAPLPPHLADLMSAPERYDTLPADLEALKARMLKGATPGPVRGSA
ncbi:threonine synthase [Yunchengibacter salinarum]|uniref:threonine synthase n=1 Tax=Yunchengibacter salinarum TaxID=3133399 RepID=UPI0035B6A8A1